MDLRLLVIDFVLVLNDSFYFTFSVAVFLGVWCCITIFPMCIVAGIWQILSGLVVIFVEAPFCAPFCGQFIPPLAKFTQIVEARPPWQRAAVYLV